MATKSRKTSHIAPLQELTLVPITDPAKQIALEKRLRRGRHAVARNGTRSTVNMPRPITASEVMDQARQLPLEQKRLLALTLLAEELSPDQQLELLERFQTRLAR